MVAVKGMLSMKADAKPDRTSDGEEPAGHGDGRRLETQRAVEHEAHDGEAQHRERPFQDDRVFDLRGNIDGVEVFFIHLARVELLMEEQDHRDHRKYGGDDDSGRQIDHEVIEIEVRRRADHDVRRVADHEGRAADVGHEDLPDEDRHGGDLHHAAEGQGHRRDEERRRDGIDEGRGNARDDGEQHEEHPRVAAARLHRPEGHRFKEARPLHHGDEHHHARQQAEGIEVDVLFQRRVLRDEAAVDHQPAACKGADRTGDLLRHDPQVGQKKYAYGDVKCCRAVHNASRSRGRLPALFFPRAAGAGFASLKKYILLF